MHLTLIRGAGKSARLLIFHKEPKHLFSIFNRMPVFSNIIYTFADRFKNLWASSPSASVMPSTSDIYEKCEVEGYLMCVDSAANKSLILVKENTKYWKTSWFDNTLTNYKSPTLPLSEIFMVRN